MTKIGVEKKDIMKKMREISIFRNMVEVSNSNGVKTVLHKDDMTMYNSWNITSYHSVDDILYRGNSNNLPEEYKPYLVKIGSPDSVIVTKSTQDTY